VVSPAIFHQVDTRLDYLIKKGNLALARLLILELGQQALGENGDWVLLHRERPLEMPHGAG